MSLTAKMITFDCADPQKLAGFWAEATGGAISDDWGVFVRVQADGIGVQHLGFQLVPEPKSEKNRCHVDFVADDPAAEVARLTGLGAVAFAEHSQGPLAWTQMRDPEGNEFCVANM